LPIDPETRYNLDMTRVSALPLFPLNLVLFPGQLLPLHIFEPRYRLMINECLSGQALFGVVLIRQAQEVSGEATPFEVGTTARIGQIERLEDGRMNILCVGETRFKVTALHHHRPFLTGDAELWPWTPLLAGDVEPQTSQLKRLLKRYMLRLAQATGNSINLEDMPVDPAPLASLAAIALQISTREKQDLLSLASIGEMMDGCIRLLKRENRALQIAAALPSTSDENVLPFSSN
jgi:Lon protease-like protein